MDNKNELISMIDKFKGESRNEVESKTKMLEDYASMIQDYVMYELNNWQNVHNMYITAS